jgi:hypothetical protein
MLYSTRFPSLLTHFLLLSARFSHSYYAVCARLPLSDVTSCRISQLSSSAAFLSRIFLLSSSAACLFSFTSNSTLSFTVRFTRTLLHSGSVLARFPSSDRLIPPSPVLFCLISATRPRFCPSLRILRSNYPAFYLLLTVSFPLYSLLTLVGS